MLTKPFFLIEQLNPDRRFITLRFTGSITLILSSVPNVTKLCKLENIKLNFNIYIYK